MLKFLKFIVGILLLPLAYAFSIAFYELLQHHAGGRGIGTHAQWFWGGFAAWLLLFLVFPKPMRTYVLAHELTHALWGLVMGARVSRLRVSSRGGSVTLNKSNLWITLAPYFFPFYSALALLVYGLLGIWWDMTIYEPLWYGVFGLTWCFHLTFTLLILGVKQPDIQEHGRVFSYAFIYCINLATASALLNFLAGTEWSDLAAALGHQVTLSYGFCLQQARLQGFAIVEIITGNLK